MGSDAAPPSDDEPPPIEDVRAARARVLGAGRWPEVVADIGAGRGFAAHARLLRIRKAARSDSERQAIDRVLEDRRLFVEPVGSTPGLGRVNGIGTGMYGSSAHDRSDGTYVKTRSFSAFWIPLFPLDQWLVQDADGGGWFFHARVPLDRAMRRARVLAISIAACAVAIGVAVSWWASSHADLHLVNGLDVAAEIVVDDGPVRRVESGERTAVTVGAGRHHIRCTVGGRVVDERDETVHGGAALVAYNVAGAAPLGIQDIIYVEAGSASRSNANALKPRFDLLAGSAFVQQLNVKWVFTEAPDHVDLPGRSRSVTHRQALLLDGGWRRSVEVAQQLGRAAQAADVAEAVALAQPDDDAVGDEAVAISNAGRSPEEHKQFVERLEAARRH